MSLLVPKQFVTQPRTLGEVNQSSPYSKGLVSLGTTVNGVLRDFVNRANFTRGAFALADVPRVSTDSRFTGVYASATSTSGAYWDLPLPSTLKFNDRNEITIFAVAYSTVTTASPRRRVIRVGTAASFLAGIDFSDVSSNSFSALVANTSGTPKVLVSSITPSANTPYAVCVVRKAADVTFYVNGQVPTQSVSPAGSTSNNSFDIDRISIDGNVTGSSLTGGVLVYGLWNRALSAQEVFALSQNPWQLFTKTQTTPLFFDVGGGGGQTLLPSLYTNDQTFYSPTVTPGTVTLQPGLFTNDQTFFAPTVTAGAVTLQPALYTNDQVFYGPTVTAGAVTLTPALYTNDQTFYGPTVSQGAAAQTLTPDLYTNTQSFYAPTVTPGAVTLTPDLYTNTQAFYSPTVSQVAEQTIYPSLFINQNLFFSPDVSQAGGGASAKGGWATERRRLELSIQQRQAQQTLAQSKDKVAKKVAKRIERFVEADYQDEIDEIAALQKEFAKLEARYNNSQQLSTDLREATKVLQEFIQDEQDAIDLLMLVQEFDARCVIEATASPDVASLMGSV